MAIAVCRAKDLVVPSHSLAWQAALGAEMNGTSTQDARPGALGGGGGCWAHRLSDDREGRRQAASRGDAGDHQQQQQD